MEEAVTLLSLGAEADPVLVLRINNLPQSYYHQSVVWDRDTTAKEEKRIAKSMEKKAAELWVLLDQAPDRLANKQETPRLCRGGSRCLT
jgi:hypothetical protein